VAFYSTYGHIYRLAQPVAEGAETVPDAEVRLRRIPELEEARRPLSSEEAYLRSQQQAEIPEATHDETIITAPSLSSGGNGRRLRSRFVAPLSAGSKRAPASSAYHPRLLQKNDSKLTRIMAGTSRRATIVRSDRDIGLEMHE
jgi:hypothetical protein